MKHRRNNCNSDKVLSEEYLCLCFFNGGVSYNICRRNDDHDEVTMKRSRIFRSFVVSPLHADLDRGSSFFNQLQEKRSKRSMKMSHIKRLTISNLELELVKYSRFILYFHEILCWHVSKQFFTY